MLDLAILADSWGEEGGGRERYLAALSAFFVNEGHRVEVICARGRERPFARATEAFRSAHPRGVLLAARPAAGATHWQLHAGLLRASFAAEREAMEAGLRKALYPLANRLNRRRARLLSTESRLLASPSRPRLMVWSGALAEELRRTHGVPGSSVTVLPPGVELKDGAPARALGRWAESGETGLLFAAHNFALKGLSPLLTALSLAARRGLRFRLAIAGRGRAGPFRRLANRLGLGERVHFLGPVPPSRMAGLLASADVLVHPTFFDPFSLVCLEALAAGTPVVTTRRNGLAERMVNGREGLLLDDPRDVAGLADALRSLADRAERERMGRSAVELASLFPFERHARAVVDWLRDEQPSL